MHACFVLEHVKGTYSLSLIKSDRRSVFSGSFSGSISKPCCHDNCVVSASNSMCRILRFNMLVYPETVSNSTFACFYNAQSCRPYHWGQRSWVIGQSTWSVSEARWIRSCKCNKCWLRVQFSESLSTAPAWPQKIMQFKKLIEPIVISDPGIGPTLSLSYQQGHGYSGANNVSSLCP